MVPSKSSGDQEEESFYPFLNLVSQIDFLKK
jgi:hypothetical protein